MHDARESVVMPGLVDTHVHIIEPGRTDWEGFETPTRAAAAGGVTSLIDMPLNSIPRTTIVAALEAKRAAARRKCRVNVGFWGGVVPGNSGELRALGWAGVFGFNSISEVWSEPLSG
jgi:allantoinase